MNRLLAAVPVLAPDEVAAWRGELQAREAARGAAIGFRARQGAGFGPGAPP